MSNRQIAVFLGLKHHDKVAVFLKKNNLAHNGSVRREKLLIKGDHGLCTKCRKWKALSHFRVNRRGEVYAYRLTFCNQCGWLRRNLYLNANPQAFVKDALSVKKNHAKHRKMAFNLDLEYILMMLRTQRNTCAYTGTSLQMVKGVGLLDDTLSFDRWNSALGYIKGNVLICTKRVNVVKSNLPLKIFKEWMPSLYKNGAKYIKKYRSLHTKI